MPAPFRDRTEAGRELGARLRKLAGDRTLVLGLPRGGVPVAAEVARVLAAPLDVLVVRKLGVPGEEELAMGAIAAGVRVLNDEVVRMLGLGAATIEAVAEREGRELQRRERLYRGARPALEVRGRTVIVVDDGVATGSTMRAAVEALRKLGPARILVAAPVMSRQARAELARLADSCECLEEPEPFYGVGVWYSSFPQTTDQEVHDLLARHPAPSGASPTAPSARGLLPHGPA